MNKKIKRELINILELPKEVDEDSTKITIMNFDEILIENYKGIMEYEEFFIRINTNIGIINLNGFNLNLKQITENDVIVKGKIENIDLERIC